MKGKRYTFTLGPRAFFLFLSKRIKFAILLFALAGAAWYGSSRLSGEFGFWAVYAAELLTLISILYFLVVLLRTYMEYRTYTYSFTEEAFVVTRGYMTRTELATLYHQIQNVNIERGPFDRMYGVSRIVIFLAGQYDTPHNRIVLPAIERRRAQLVQEELIIRARKHSGPTPGNRTVRAPRPGL